MEYVTLAKIISTHGIKGDLKLFPLTDFAKIRFKKGKTFELYNEETKKTFNVTCFSFKTSGKFIVVHLMNSIHLKKQLNITNSIICRL